MGWADNPKTVSVKCKFRKKPRQQWRLHLHATKSFNFTWTALN